LTRRSSTNSPGRGHWWQRTHRFPTTEFSLRSQRDRVAVARRSDDCAMRSPVQSRRISHGQRPVMRLRWQATRGQNDLRVKLLLPSRHRRFLMPALSHANCRAGASPAKLGNRRGRPTFNARKARPISLPLPPSVRFAVRKS